MSRVLPILFNTDMVQAILDGRKTVTRRICKDGNDYVVPDISFYDTNKRTYAVHNYANKEHTEKLSLVERICPICPDDILYVRETWGVMSAKRYDACVNIAFKAGGENKTIYFPNGGTNSINRNEYDEFIKKWDKASTLSWHPSIHMPKEAARLFLKVTNVRVERLQAMTLDDFLAEGVVIRPEAFNDPDNAYLQARDVFVKIWDSTVKKEQIYLYGWDGNPWVWTIEFERCGKPEEL